MDMHPLTRTVVCLVVIAVFISSADKKHDFGLIVKIVFPIRV